jgi:hypothetical protein
MTMHIFLNNEVCEECSVYMQVYVVYLLLKVH